MLLKKIRLVNFRNFFEESFSFDKKMTLIVGKNSLGKTNLLEAVYFLANGFGFREIKEEELLNFNKDEGLVEGVIGDENNDFYFSIKISIDQTGLKKRFFIDKKEKKYHQYVFNQLKTVLFSPDQINIITGSPSLRRDYFDKLISTFDFEYKKKLTNYLSALKKRNKILETKFNDVDLDEELDFWNNYLIKEGSYLIKKRQEYVDFLNLNQAIDSKKFSIIYCKNEINKQAFLEKKEEEKRLRKTLIGPQKDDFLILAAEKNQKKDVAKFGSRSEQRLAVFWLKINEIKYLENFFKKKPIVLLDDIFSELDEENQKIIFPLLDNYQTIATSIKLPVNNNYYSIYL
ncbi:MAG: DNA replication/repair protein RecF [Microgenomates group bacterium]